MINFEKIVSLLKANNCIFEELSHDFVHTSKDAAKVRGTKIEFAAKAIVLKADNKSIMCVLGGDKKIDFKKIKKTLGIKNLRLEDPNKVLELTGCKIGTVPPLGNLFDLTTYFDVALKNSDYLVFSAASHYKSIKMPVKDYLEFTNPTLLDFSSLK
ncbi:MAG: YbaK/EbsC family protein [Candidatus Woesearchaeota archaeon]